MRRRSACVEPAAECHAGFDTTCAGPSISVVIPALNEEEALPQTVASVRGQEPPPHDVVVVDAGSVDRTAEVARAAGARVISSARGRAVQMNAGAATSEGDVILFLHSDTELPPGALKAIQRYLADPLVLGGCFQLRFDKEAESMALWLWGWCTRCWLCRTPSLVFGDRAIFVRRSAFTKLDGYMLWPLMEDVDFAMRLAALGGRGSFAFVPLSVTTSARRLLATGPLRQQLINTLIVVSWRLGWSPESLKKMYLYKAPAPSARPDRDAIS